MTVVMGTKPLPMELPLNQGFDYVVALDSEDGDWPGTAVIALVFDDPDATTWTATLNGATAEWDVDKAEVDALIAKLPAYPNVKLTYTDGTAELPWMAGRVYVSASE